METEFIYENIAFEIQEFIKSAQHSIYVAVKCFTQEEIFNQLVEKNKEDCKLLLSSC